MTFKIIFLTRPPHDDDYIADDTNRRERILRRQELNELRKLQHDEQRAMSILTARLTGQMEMMLHAFEQERMHIETKYASRWEIEWIGCVRVCEMLK